MSSVIYFILYIIISSMLITDLNLFALYDD